MVGGGHRLGDRLRRRRRGRGAPAAFGGQGTRDRAGGPQAGEVMRWPSDIAEGQSF